MVPPSHIFKVLAGTWILINNTAIFENGTIIPQETYPTGAHPVGLIHYTHTGYMSANIMSTTPSHRPENLIYPPQADDTDVDWAKVGRHTLTYAGPFSVQIKDETHGLLHHGPLVYAGIPSWVGSDQKRNYTLFERNNILRLQAYNEKSGSTGNLFWRRAGPSWEDSSI